MPDTGKTLCPLILNLLGIQNLGYIYIIHWEYRARFVLSSEAIFTSKQEMQLFIRYILRIYQPCVKNIDGFFWFQCLHNRTVVC